MNILLVEDNALKRRVIEVSLNMLRPDAKIRCFGNLADAQMFVLDNADVIDLLVLDWCFPEHRLEKAEFGQGQKMLDFIYDNHLDIKTIICSGDDLSETTLIDDYYFLLGIVLFGGNNPGTEILSIYNDYWAKVSDLYGNPTRRSGVKKLVNYHVK